MQFSPYLHFNGECEAACKFYESCLGGKIQAMMTFDGTPMAKMMPPEWRKKIIHARIDIGDRVLMGSDPPPDRYQKPQGFSVNIDVKTPAEAERVFRALSDGGNVTMPLQQTFWAARFAMFTDRFGIPWMINCESAE
jgi:PhnB protein